MAKETRKSKEKVDKKALVERIKTLEGKINDSQTALTDSAEIEVLKEKIENYKDISDRAISAYKESHDKKINTYRNLGIIIISLLTFIGGGSIYLVINVSEKTAKNTATIAAKTELKRLINNEEILKQVKNKAKNIEDVLKQAETESKVVIRSLNEKVENEARKIEEKSGKSIDKFLSELETKSKGRLSMLDDRLAALERLRNEYATSLADLKGEAIDINKPAIEETVVQLEQLEKELTQAKTKNKLSFEDWFYKGVSASNEKEYANAIVSFTNALEENPKVIRAYIGRGTAYSNLKQYDKALEDYNKVVNLDPEDVFANLCISELKVMKGDYESALNSITKALALSPDLGDDAIVLYQECITKKLLNMDTTECDATFNEILQKDFTVDWSFEMVESWLDDTEIDDDTKTFIKEKTELIKQKQ